MTSKRATQTTRSPSVIQLIGSLRMAVVLLITIATVLAWGTIYEVRFGTAAVQRFVYQAWWFQALLGFLALNLGVAALQRYPWRRQHLPFVLAHLGIICILLGGIVGGRFGIDGQLIIPEGQADGTLDLPQSVLTVHESSTHHNRIIPTRFEAQAWVHEPAFTVPVAVGDRQLELSVDRYYPDAVVQEEIAEDGAAEHPAIHLRLRHGAEEETVWLFARDPQRFGVGWGGYHILFLEPTTTQQVAQLFEAGSDSSAARGTLSMALPGRDEPYELAIPERFDGPVSVPETPYHVAFKDYFPDFAMGAQGPMSRSDAPNNPAVAFTVTGPEGTDAYLLFAFHPDISALHGWTHLIPAEITYVHPAAAALPPNAVAVVRLPSGGLAAALTAAEGRTERRESLAVGEVCPHPDGELAVELLAFAPRARIVPHVSNRSNEVRREALHVIVREGNTQGDAWVHMRESVEVAVGDQPVTVAYQPAERELPFIVKLLDFRKIDYPGTEMAAGFESDVELTDAQRGVILMRQISMNEPLRYRGYHLYQSSYVAGTTETTILSVRNDPGTPLVYAGFLCVIGGIVAMFVGRARRTRRA